MPDAKKPSDPDSGPGDRKPWEAVPRGQFHGTLGMRMTTARGKPFQFRPAEDATRRAGELQPEEASAGQPSPGPSTQPPEPAVDANAPAVSRTPLRSLEEPEGGKVSRAYAKFRRLIGPTG